jgi:hypothetical protein
VNVALGVIFTTIHFLCNLQMVQQARMFVPGQPFQPSVMQHYSLLGSFVSYEENKVL